MQIVIDISKEDYETIKQHTGSYSYGHAIANGIVLPENPTNGDMIKALFPDAEIIINKKNMISWMYKGMIKTYPLDWWNSPYKRGETE